MDDILFIIIQFSILLNLKHFISEFILQTPEIAGSKTRYGSINSFIHIIHHAFGTMMALLIIDIPTSITLGLVALEAFIHYHVDWLTMRFGAQSYKDKTYWQWLGAQQFAHHITYVIIVIMVIYYLTHRT